MPKNFPFSALRRFAARLAVGLALVLPALTVPTLGAEAVTPLVGVDWLKAHLNDPNLVVLDIRSAIDGGGVKAYEAAHIPGSVHSDYDKAGWRVTRNNVPFMVPTAAELEKLIGDLGIDEDTPCRGGAGGRERARLRLRRAHLLDAEIRRRRQRLDPRRRRRRLAAGRPAGRERRSSGLRPRFSVRRSTRACWPRRARSRRSRRTAVRL